MKNLVDRSYHFFLNGKHLEENKQKLFLQDIFGVFCHSDKAYVISFNFYTSITK